MNMHVNETGGQDVAICFINPDVISGWDIQNPFRLNIGNPAILNQDIQHAIHRTAHSAI